MTTAVINRIKEINDEANAGISEGEEHRIKVANAGWYTLLFKGKITEDKKNIDWTLSVYPTKVYILGGSVEMSGTWAFDDAYALTAPADKNGKWVSPAFTASAELLRSCQGRQLRLVSYRVHSSQGQRLLA